MRYCLSLLSLSFLLSPAPAQTLLSAADVLDALPLTISLEDVLAVAIIPDAAKSRTAISGYGVLMIREDGTWRDPVFVTLGNGGSRHSGDETVDLIIEFKSRRSLSRVVSGDGHILAEAAYATGRGRVAEISLEGSKLSKSSVFHRGYDA